jgi:hypothetical protein
MKLKIYEVIETKEMLRCELIENYYAVYEETEIKEFNLDNSILIEKDTLFEKSVTLFKGNSHSTLQKVKTYNVRSHALENIGKLIYKDYPEVFKPIQIKQVV